MAQELPVRIAFKIVPFTLIAALLLAACGADEPTPTPVPAATATPTAAPTATAVPDDKPADDDTTGGPTGGLDLATLLSVAEVQAAFPELTSITTNQVDFYAMAQNVDPVQVVGMDAFKGLVFQSGDGGGLTLSVVDFASADLADAYLTLSTEGLDASTVEGSEQAFQGQGGGGTAVIAKRGDLAVSINTSGLSGSDAELEAVKELAALALSRLE
jgi:hypothetical protein